jgi:hypothetical protein
MNSGLFKLTLPDWAKAFIMAVLGAVLPVIGSALQSAFSSAVPFDWTSVLDSAWKTGVAAAIAYLTKNFFTNSAGQPFTSEPPSGAAKTP